MSLIDIGQFSTPGLYLVMPDGEQIVLTHEGVEAAARALLDDETALPPHVRAAVQYAPCAICPERDTAEICHAIMPTLPFFDDIDRFMSYDKVTAIYRETGSDFWIVSETTMQEALQYITILSLVHYCEVGQQYSQYFAGVNPLMPLPDIGKAVFHNIYLAEHGDLKSMNAIVDSMNENILTTARCQMARLRLISKRDAYLNAFVNTELITQFVLKELNTHMSEAALANG